MLIEEHKYWSTPTCYYAHHAHRNAGAHLELGSSIDHTHLHAILSYNSTCNWPLESCQLCSMQFGWWNFLAMRWTLNPWYAPKNCLFVCLFGLSKLTSTQFVCHCSMLANLQFAEACTHHYTGLIHRESHTSMNRSFLCLEREVLDPWEAAKITVWIESSEAWWLSLETQSMHAHCVIIVTR